MKIIVAYITCPVRRERLHQKVIKCFVLINALCVLQLRELFDDKMGE